MVKSKKSILSGWIILYSSFNMMCQSNSVASGNNINSAGGSVSYSIGQIDYISASSINGNINQGVQQPLEIYIVTNIKDENIKLIASVYPNPIIDLLNLEIGNIELTGLFYRVTDIQGKFISESAIMGPKTTIQINDYSNGTYFLTVSKNESTLQTFKIIKTK